MNDFYKDLEIGKRGETMVADALTARNHKVIDVSDNWDYRKKDIDFVLINKENQQTTLEIKNDVASERTGNFFIEFYNINNRSHNYNGWLDYCEAEYICFLQEHNKLAYIVSLGELKNKINENAYRTANSYGTKGYLIPVNAIKEFDFLFLLEVE